MKNLGNSKGVKGILIRSYRLTLIVENTPFSLPCISHKIAKFSRIKHLKTTNFNLRCQTSSRDFFSFDPAVRKQRT